MRLFGGMYRLRVRNGDYVWSLATASNRIDFNTRPNGTMESFRLEFGMDMRNYHWTPSSQSTYKASAWILACRTRNLPGGGGLWTTGEGWGVEMWTGWVDGEWKRYIRFHSNGAEHLHSVSMNTSATRRWNRVTIDVDGSAGGPQVEVTITIAGVGGVLSGLDIPGFKMALSGGAPSQKKALVIPWV